MAFRTQKISQMTPKGSDLEATDLLEVSTIESGSYVTRSITGQEIIDAAASSGGVTDVTATAPIVSTGGTTPDISIATANTSTTGALSSTDWNTFNNKLSGVHALLQPSSGGMVTTQLTASATSNLTAGTLSMKAVPFLPNTTFNSTSFSINVTAAQTGANGIILIYSSLNGKPDQKLYESANLDCSTIGVKTALLSFTFSAGVTYWICTQFSNLSVQLTSQNIASLLNIGISSGFNHATAYLSNVAFGSAPTTFVITSLSATSVSSVNITVA